MDGESRFEAWVEFHRANPAVFDIFLEFSRRARARGVKRLGARLIGERIRWHIAVETTDHEFKLNNNHLPYYSRLAMLVSPELEGVFSRRDTHFDATDDEILAAHSRQVVGA